MVNETKNVGGKRPANVILRRHDATKMTSGGKETTVNSVSGLKPACPPSCAFPVVPTVPAEPDFLSYRPFRLHLSQKYGEMLMPMKKCALVG